MTTRRGFFGALAGSAIGAAVGLPLAATAGNPYGRRKSHAPASRYPPVVWRNADPVGDEWKDESPYEEGQVYRCYYRPGPHQQFWDERDWRIAKSVCESYYVVVAMPPHFSGQVPIYLSKILDHRPTWAEVREIVANANKERDACL